MWSHCSVLHIAVSFTFKVHYKCPSLDAAWMQVIETAHHVGLGNHGHHHVGPLQNSS